MRKWILILLRAAAVVIFIGMLSLVGYATWIQRLENEAAKRRVRQVNTMTTLRRGQDVKVSATAFGGLPASDEPILVVVQKANCPECLTTIDLWRDALSTLGTSVTARLLDLGPASLPSASRQELLPFEHVRVRDPYMFAAHTGVTAVPFSAVISNLHLQCVVIGVPTPTALSECFTPWKTGRGRDDVFTETNAERYPLEPEAIPGAASKAKETDNAFNTTIGVSR